MKTLTKLTKNQAEGVKNELLITEKKLNKELAYSQDLQNTNRIAELKAHIVRLNGMILNGWNAPKFN